MKELENKAEIGWLEDKMVDAGKEGINWEIRESKSYYSDCLKGWAVTTTVVFTYETGLKAVFDIPRFLKIDEESPYLNSNSILSTSTSLNLSKAFSYIGIYGKDGGITSNIEKELSGEQVVSDRSVKEEEKKGVVKESMDNLAEQIMNSEFPKEKDVTVGDLSDLAKVSDLPKKETKKKKSKKELIVNKVEEPVQKVDDGKTYSWEDIVEQESWSKDDLFYLVKAEGIDLKTILNKLVLRVEDLFNWTPIVLLDLPIKGKVTIELVVEYILVRQTKDSRQLSEFIVKYFGDVADNTAVDQAKAFLKTLVKEDKIPLAGDKSNGKGNVIVQSNADDYTELFMKMSGPMIKAQLTPDDLMLKEKKIPVVIKMISVMSHYGYKSVAEQKDAIEAVVGKPVIGTVPEWLKTCSMKTFCEIMKVILDGNQTN
jgi:hypothetical protein